MIHLDQATDLIWTMEEQTDLIGLRVDCGDAGVLYFTHDQAKQVVDAFQMHLATPTAPVTEGKDTK